ncbi:MAG: hypothetical protein ACKVPJ_09330, partial [Chitinophagales bacterium]
MNKVKQLQNESADTSQCDIWNDTICRSGNFIKYVKIDSFYDLTYGNKYFSKRLGYEFNCSAPAGIIPYLYWENQDFICVKRSCGSYCGVFLFLPLDTNSNAYHKENVLAYEKQTNDIAYLKYLDDKVYIVIENLKTHYLREEQLENFATCPEPLECVESVNFLNNKFLLIKWKSLKDGFEKMQ